MTDFVWIKCNIKDGAVSPIRYGSYYFYKNEQEKKPTFIKMQANDFAKFSRTGTWSSNYFPKGILVEYKPDDKDTFVEFKDKSGEVLYYTKTRIEKVKPEPKPKPEPVIPTPPVKPEPNSDHKKKNK